MGDEARVFRAPKGTNEILPPRSWRWVELTRLALDTFSRAGYAPIETPIFEHTEVFARGVGEASEVVTKQMYTFADKGGRSLTLRPEGTAPTIRAILEHGLHRGALPIKLSYAGPFFRQERPQKGRFRQFFQVGIEAVGSDSALVDAEVIEVGSRFLEAAGARSRLLLNSIGHPDLNCRDGYIVTLREYLTARRDALAEEDRDRVDGNPLRTFDSKEEKTIGVMRDAPVITEHLCDACRKHFDDVQALLRELGIEFTLEPRLVRGLDYYTRTAFEYIAEGLGAQNAVGGGGRYDGLSEALGGPPLPAIGFALGLDRIALASGNADEAAPLDCYVVAMGERAATEALRLTTELRRAGLGADLDLVQRSLKGQMKDAARSGARWAVILGDQEIERGEATLKQLHSGEQESVALADVLERVRQ
ncbi:MAG TPA: histidine--tRNA ligase [Actinomycetota bacterium]|nr:histidine--tRNA ligase [Actinomycetota bacterium]